LKAEMIIDTTAEEIHASTQGDNGGIDIIA